MTDHNRTAETDEARDLVDTFQLEWDASYPGMHFKCVPSVTRLVRMGEYIARAVDETLAEFDLNRGEAEVLFALVRNPHIDITPKVIQTRILVSSGGLTRRLDRLEEKGLISRLPDPNDRRGTVLKATKAGIVLALPKKKRGWFPFFLKTRRKHLKTYSKNSFSLRKMQFHLAGCSK